MTATCCTVRWPPPSRSGSWASPMKRVLSAIACHTTGKVGMTVLDKVLFIADAIEPNRADYPGLSEMRALVTADLDAAVLMSMRRTKEYVLARGLHFCSQTEQAMQDIENKRRNNHERRTCPGSARGGDPL